MSIKISTASRLSGLAVSALALTKAMEMVDRSNTLVIETTSKARKNLSFVKL